MRRLALIPCFAAFSALAALPKIVATVNGTPIYQSELNAELNRNQGEKPTEALNRLVLFRLAVDQARHEGLDRKPEVRQEMDQVLYRRFIEAQLKESKETLVPSAAELKASYQKSPLIRVRELVLRTDGPETASTRRQTRLDIEKQLKHHGDFESLILEYSQADSLRSSGDLGFRGMNDLPTLVYQTGLTLKNGEISRPLTLPGKVVWIQKTETKNFSAAPETYLELLRARLTRDRETKWLSSKLQSLKRKSRIRLAEENS